MKKKLTNKEQFQERIKVTILSLYIAGMFIRFLGQKHVGLSLISIAFGFVLYEYLRMYWFGELKKNVKRTNKIRTY